MGSETSKQWIRNSGRRTEISHKTSFCVVHLYPQNEVHEMDKTAYGLAANELP